MPPSYRSIDRIHDIASRGDAALIPDKLNLRFPKLPVTKEPIDWIAAFYAIEPKA